VVSKSELAAGISPNAFSKLPASASFLLSAKYASSAITSVIYLFCPCSSSHVLV